MSPRWMLLLGLLLCAVPLSAGMYKWVDENGVTHYSENPPPGRKARQIQAPPSTDPKPAEPASTWGERELDFRRRSIEREQAEEKKRGKEAERVALRKEACLDAQHMLEALSIERPIYRMNEKGEREYMADGTRAAAVRRMKENVETYCTPE